MSVQFVLLPVFVQVALTLVLGFLLFMSRASQLRSRQVRWQDIALGEPRWSPAGLQRANAFRNQFELPVLFYVLMILLIITRHADVIMLVLAWIFVLSRIAHAFVHVTSNSVPHRGIIYGVGGLVLIVMWIIFAVRILAGMP
jgi:hypothetical protein